MSFEIDFFRRAGLTPTAKKAGTGFCRCDPRAETTLYKTNGGLRCDVCSSLNQAYPTAPPSEDEEDDAPMNRLTEGSYLLITPQGITFWGKTRVDLVNPEIEIRSATGQMSRVQKDLILNPPETPWMLYSFGKSNNSSAIRVTEDNRRMRFGGKTQISKQVITEINRDQIMQMLHVGMTLKEWEAYVNEYAQDRSRKVMTGLEAKYPGLRDLRRIPPLGSPEYLALRFILTPNKKGA
jgi:hypothetical protein